MRRENGYRSPDGRCARQDSARVRKKVEVEKQQISRVRGVFFFHERIFILGKKEIYFQRI